MLKQSYKNVHNHNYCNTIMYNIIIKTNKKFPAKNVRQLHNASSISLYVCPSFVPVPTAGICTATITAGQP